MTRLGFSLRPLSSRLGSVIRLAGLLFVAGWTLAACESASAQSDWIRRLDANGNGYIEPNELSDRSRSFMERFASQSGIDLSRANSVGRLEAAARRYFEQRQRDADSAKQSMPTGIPGFGAISDQPVVPGFGLGEIRYPYNQADLAQADETLSRSDRNRDGFLDASEIERARWDGQSPVESDLDGDGRLSRLELAQRYARRRLFEERTRQGLGGVVSTTPRPTGSGASSPEPSDPRRDRRSRGADRGSRYLAFTLLERYDLNKNGMLEASELANTGIDLGRADFNRDGLVDLNELADFLFQEMELQGANLSELLPTWFYERDLNADGQVEMSEFTDVWTAEKVAEFESYDSDGDGIITPMELLSSSRITGGDFSNRTAQVLLPRSVVVSEIQVNEDIVIGSLKVELSITHTFVSHLDAFLIGPEGQRIELFSGIGGSDDHFDRTVFDDQARENITKARAPYRGSFQPGSIAKRQPGLATFNGKSLKGVWQLMIRSSRSDRAGVLNNWSLLVKPAQETVDQLSSPESPQLTSSE